MKQSKVDPPFVSSTVPLKHMPASVVLVCTFLHRRMPETSGDEQLEHEGNPTNPLAFDLPSFGPERLSLTEASSRPRTSARMWAASPGRTCGRNTDAKARILGGSKTPLGFDSRGINDHQTDIFGSSGLSWFEHGWVHWFQFGSNHSLGSSIFQNTGTLPGCSQGLYCVHRMRTHAAGTLGQLVHRAPQSRDKTSDITCKRPLEVHIFSIYAL